jgi:Flp pilus assembly protein TadD
MQYEAHVNLAIFQLQEGQLEEAIKSADRAIAAAPRFALAHQVRGRVLVKMGRADDSAISLNTAAGLDPKNPSVLLEAGNVCMRAAHYAEALEHFKGLSALIPNRWEPLSGQARAYMGLHRYQDAGRAIDLALKLAPGERSLLELARQVEQIKEGG